MQYAIILYTKMLIAKPKTLIKSCIPNSNIIKIPLHKHTNFIGARYKWKNFIGSRVTAFRQSDVFVAVFAFIIIVVPAAL